MGGRRSSAPRRHSGTSRLLPSSGPALLEIFRIRLHSVNWERDGENHMGARRGSCSIAVPPSHWPEQVTWACLAARESGKCSPLCGPRGNRGMAGCIHRMLWPVGLRWGRGWGTEGCGVGWHLHPRPAVRGTSPFVCPSSSPERGNGG